MVSGLQMIKAFPRVETFSLLSSDPDCICISETPSPIPKCKGRQLPVRMITLR